MKKESQKDNKVSVKPIKPSDFVKMYQLEKDWDSYKGELGVIYSKEKSIFRLWAPTATTVKINFYKKGTGKNLIESIDMIKDIQGTWVLEKQGDLNKTYYTYLVTVDGVENEAVDPYAKAVGANGLRGMVIDLAATNPKDWNKDKSPEFKNPTDAVIYELHVRDMSSDPLSGIKNKGKFIAFTEEGTKNQEGLSTGIDHLKELGITHVHLLPVFDFFTIDETSKEEQYNWGYDPQNYNVPEGSYSTNPNQGDIRIKEFKKMVQALHKNQIRVVMDVVYNHTGETEEVNLHKIVPNYYHRTKKDGFWDGSACGNEVASEKNMVRKFMVDSVIYWAKEYHIDGFRFDLMGLHDIKTMNTISKELHKIDSSILIYGEGWTAGECGIKEENRSLKKYASKLNNIAVFSDDVRDGIKGDVFELEEKGFVNGKKNMEEVIKFSVVASTENNQIDCTKIGRCSDAPWAKDPTQTITYCSAHDNLSLWDKLEVANPENTREEKIRMNKLAAAIVFSCQGIPFIQAGEEILRSKPKEGGGFDENSYKSSDFTNSIRWSTKTENIKVFNYYKGLIEFRKAHPGLRMTTTKEVQDNIKFLSKPPKNVVAFTVNETVDENNQTLLVIYNANNKPSKVKIPSGEWNIYVNSQDAGIEVLDTFKGNTIEVENISALILVSKK